MCSSRRLTNHWKNGNMHRTTTQYSLFGTYSSVVRDEFEPVPPSGVDDDGIDYSKIEGETTKVLEFECHLPMR